MTKAIHTFIEMVVRHKIVFQVSHYHNASWFHLLETFFKEPGE